MQGFDKNYTKSKKVSKSSGNLDEYEISVKNSAVKRNKMEIIALSQQSTNKMALSYLNRGYTLILVGILSAAISYPLSVKIVKKVFGLKSFFNIHFAILPIMLNFNAVTLGVAQGVINAEKFKKNYPISSDQNPSESWKSIL